MNVILVDPSLFTAPYDAALTRGLVVAGVEPKWLTRRIRPGDRAELPAQFTDDFFYRRTDQLGWVPPSLRPIIKGCAHLAATASLLTKIRRARPDAVHVQWVVLPLIDIIAMAFIRRWCPLVLTIHDTAPFNAMSWIQRWGSKVPAKLADCVIVHTHAGRQALRHQGVSENRVSVIPHGPLSLPMCAAPPPVRDGRWTAVLFGEIKPYKGLDILIEAVAALPKSVRRGLRVIVAGRPRMDVAPLRSRIAALGLGDQFEWRLGRLSEEQMATLFAEADGFVFPYRQIDASGVYYLVKPLRKWLIASRVGIFAEDMTSPAHGSLVPPADVPALARALEHAIAARPRSAFLGFETSWSEIGRATRAVYERAKAEFDARHTQRRRDM